MSISQDRQELYRALQKIDQFQGQPITVSATQPQKVEPYIAYIELVNVAQASVFGKIEITWEIIATGSARLNNSAATIFLDNLADRIIKTIVDAGAADLENMDPYFVLTDNSTNGSVPAVRITFKSIIEN